MMEGLSVQARAWSSASDMSASPSSPFLTLRLRQHASEREERNSHENLPVVGLEALGDVLREGDRGGAVDGDLVVVVHADEVAESEVTKSWISDEVAGRG